ncbi:MAG: phosphoribosylamine--glycine ligase [Pseudomonadota bacterium]
MHILLVGGGAREHALAWKIAQSPLVTTLTMVPRNPGMMGLGEEADLTIDEIPDYAQTYGVDLVVVGPEAPLADGLADRLYEAGIPCFGPNQAAAQLETSKAFTNALCVENNIPAPAYVKFTDANAAKAYLQNLPAPYVIKADGIAAGKGVVIAPTLPEAEETVETMLAGQFGAASQTIVIEEFLTGPEISVFALTDGKTLLPFGSAQDHKRAFDGDQGPNTGGMGGFSPSPLFTPELEEEVYETIIQPTLNALQAKGITYRGVMYAGLMLTDQGPKLIEYNCRFGDPECQMLLRRLKSDLVPALLGAARGGIEDLTLEWDTSAAANIVYATKGYPGPYNKGSAVHHIERAEAERVVVFHAGTKKVGDTLTAQGGRVLNVTALGKDIGDALDKAYQAIAEIDWPKGFYRKDIGQKYRSREGER